MTWAESEWGPMPGPADPQDEYLPDEPCAICGQRSAVRITVKGHRTDDDGVATVLLHQEYYCAEHYHFDGGFGAIIIGAPGDPGTMTIPVVLPEETTDHLHQVDWKGGG